MLDADIVNRLVQDEIKKNVNAQIDTALSSSDWLQDLESRIVSHVQDRITARFSNISTVPDLVSTVSSSVEKMFKDGLVPSLDNLVDNTLLEQAVDQAVENLVTKTVNSLAFEPKWQEKINTQIARETGDRITRGLTETNVYDTLRDVVLDNKSIIHEDLNREVLIQDGIIVVQNHLATETLNTESDVNVGGALVVDGDLAVKGRISLSNVSFDELSDTIEKNAIDKLKKEFIGETSNTIRKQIQDGLNVKNIMVRGESLVNDDRLSSGVTKTAIQELGTLKNLQVGTELSVDNKRVGINTNAPRSALSIWDSEIEIDIGRRSQNTAQIGTSKAHNLAFITNNQEQVTIDKDGLVSVKKIRVGRNIIMTHNETPGWSGAKGDIVFNYNYKPGDAFAWLCLGAFRWHELKSA